MRSWDYSFDGETLTIRVTQDFRMALLPTILDDIFNAMWLESVEKVQQIKIERTYPYFNVDRRG